LVQEDRSKAARRMPDYIDPRLDEALEKAVEILTKNAEKWRSIVDAYWLLRRHEDEIGFPLTYNMVEEAVEKSRQLLQRGRGVVAVEA